MPSPHHPVVEPAGASRNETPDHAPVEGQTAVAAAAHRADESAWALLCELAKARLTLLVVLTAGVGFLLGSNGPLDYWLLFHTVMGTGLLASGASALNQLMERDLDARMCRTQERPLPSGRMRPGTALAFGAGTATLGLVQLGFAVNLLTAWLGAITLGTYLLIYTPLKRVSPINTLVGAFPGAMPPLMGWAAARAELSMSGWAIFVIQFFWQMPHFLAIAWLYREDYARAGFQMLPIRDPSGRQTGRHAVGHSVALLLTSLAPFALRLTGLAYLAGSLVLGGMVLLMAARFARRLDRPTARGLFLASILYLPLLLGLMVWDKGR